MTTNAIAITYLYAVVGGALPSGVLVYLLHKALDWQIGPDLTKTTERIWWVPMLMGIVERAIVVTLILWAPKVVTGFIGGWMLLKIAGGWGLLKDPTTRNRSTNFIGLMGNVISFGWAIGVAVHMHPVSLAIFNAPASN